MPPLLPEDARNLGQVFLGLHCREQQREALSLWSRHARTAHRHTADVGGTHTLSTWVGVVLQDVLGAVTSLLPLAPCDGQVSCSGHQDPASVFPFFTFLLDK